MVSRYRVYRRTHPFWRMMRQLLLVLPLQLMAGFAEAAGSCHIKALKDNNIAEIKVAGQESLRISPDQCYDSIPK